MTDSKTPFWDIDKVETDLQAALDNKSEPDLLEVLKVNSFLFFHLYSRKGGIQPIFREISFGGKYRCDFAWLNDNSDGPEWVLMELEKPQMRIFNAKGKPTSELNGAIEQVKSWQRYFHENPAEKKRIFGAVAKFRFILVAGDKKDWNNEDSMKWRTFHNANSDIELRTIDVFKRALVDYKRQPNAFWSFEENPVTLGFAGLEEYWKGYSYMDLMRKLY
ncbi:MAG TPA: Shedu anti-phage system protein SduA domain-containing protein [Bacteroidia bacterium]